jgi:hypothetical protein
MVIVKALKASEANGMPSQELIDAMMKRERDTMEQKS